MGHVYEQRVIGAFINGLRRELNMSLPVDTLSLFKEFRRVNENKQTKRAENTIAFLKKHRVKYLSELTEKDYADLIPILGKERAEYLWLVMGLYNLRGAGTAKKAVTEVGDGIAKTEVISYSD